MDRVEYHHAFGYLGDVLMKVAAFGIATPDLEGRHSHKATIDVSGERTPLACWRTSPGVRELLSATDALDGNKVSGKVRCGGTPQPARGTRALPNPAVPPVTLISSPQ